MTRVKILVEDMSELRFVQIVLTPWFSGRAIHLQPFRATTSRDRAKGRVYRGGGRSYAHVRNELRREIRAEGHKPDRKASAGPTAASDIGVAKLRDACPHFDAWLSKLESAGHYA